ncbi:SH3 domain-containing protein [Chlorogloeopsis sp. ULAP01]|uniref:SH3 domain-containing protein n=1 Tax=Chlorogloeopsis sp. ULAP01 TaxID=3056483 RepID=UPI0025AA6112|nr:SH3 domain-containing protein [Chlorogloeopsis sp. ULAP01]MDM9382287.1 SH3 domain-containing protein [Chlorogloeopsis sp. ULAP01]
MQLKNLVTACIAGFIFGVGSWSAIMAGETGVVTSRHLNIRTGPGTEYRSIFILREGDRVEIVEQKGDWAKIIGELGGEGWVETAYLSMQNPGENSSESDDNNVIQGLW